ncbi:MAG: hypothetical protein DHS20C17_13930 [Cyclobacteriaceae bacterium]|nr:MAG: hypothetical protein DHS20C17_13930 [Cyclobacteriaceae bacterium]
MNLEEIKKEKIKEAVELFIKLGIEPNRSTFQTQNSFQIPDNDEESSEKKEKLHWTRLSINSNQGCIID